MSCVGNVCGTGGWTGPLPGDPDDNLTLSARTVFSGIVVSWSWPTVNGHAVANTRLYRGLTNDFNAAIQQATVGGSIYFDRLDPETATTYYYWIRLVSVNGTVGQLIGPVSAIAEPQAEQTLESLTGRIDSGVLANALKTDIAGITLLNQELYQEIADRFAANEELSALIAAVQSGVQDSMTYISEEITARTDADSALLTQLNTMAAAVDDNVAAIFEEKTLRVTADEALATSITQLFVDVGAAQAAISEEATVRATEDEALATTITHLAADVEDASAAVHAESIARANADSSLASSINSVESSLNGNIATVQTNLQTQVNTANGKITAIGALYTAKVQVNGLVGGFGIYNDGTQVDAGFDVDLFWIGRTGVTKVKPFIVSGGVVYIDKARIRDADIDTLKIGGEAVTIPRTEARYDTISGNNTSQTVMSKSVTLPQAGSILAICTCSQSSGDGDRHWSLSLRIDGSEVAEAHGEFPADSVALSGAISVGAGSHTITLVQNSGVDSRVLSRNFTILGAMR